MKNKYIKVSHISTRKFRFLIKCFSEDINALSSARLCGLNRNTTQRIYGLLRERILDWSLEETVPFSGEIEMDESYFGARRVRGKRGRGASGKTPVIGLLKREGFVHVAVVKNAKRKELMPIIKGQALSGSTVYTDGWKAYDSLVTEGYKHKRIHHHNHEFARGKNHVNGIESFWSYAKYRMAKLRGVKRERFVTHLVESAWRFNHRGESLYRLFLKKLREQPL